MFVLTGMKVDAHCQRSSRHWHEGVRFVGWVQRNSSDALVHRVQQERAHTYPQTDQDRIYTSYDGSQTRGSIYRILTHPRVV